MLPENLSDREQVKPVTPRGAHRGGRASVRSRLCVCTRTDLLSFCTSAVLEGEPMGARERGLCKCEGTARHGQSHQAAEEEDSPGGHTGRQADADTQPASRAVETDAA